MIRSFLHKGLKDFFETGRKTGIQPDHEKRLRLRLAALDSAATVKDLSHYPGFNLHSLSGDQKGRWAISVNGNWRITFEFHDGDAFVLDYEDYH